MKSILIIEDEIRIGDALEEILVAYDVKRAYSGTEAVMLLKSANFDLVICDLNLPGISGEEVLKQFHQEVPFIVLSAKTSISDRVDNLLNGAVDYICKPFSNDELLARVAVQLRKKSAKHQEVIHYLDLKMNLKTYTVTLNDQVIKLTKTEFAILHLLMLNPNTVYSKLMILERISDFTMDGEESSISVHISSLRKKLKAVSQKEYIETIWGIGFKMCES